VRIARDAFAKVNLALDVGTPLASGLHPIASWMAPIDLRDSVEIERLPDDTPARLEVSWAHDAPRPSPIDWPHEKDLSMRALRALERALGRTLPAAIQVSKRIPVGGGLGGGSSDAAATLLALRELFALPIDDDTLRSIAMTLGSDVAYFIDDAPPRPAIVEGLGERVTRVARVPGRLALVIPAFGCPTGAVYKAFDALPSGTTGTPSGERVRAAQAHAIHAGLAHAELFNALAPAACAVVPRLALLLEALTQVGTPHVTGSGSCLFLVMPDQGIGALLDAARNATQSVDPGCTVLGVRLI
jgi:4-diphosphocytidyl-2-C-methyl-D-erythritol kinase